MSYAWNLSAKEDKNKVKRQIMAFFIVRPVLVKSRKCCLHPTTSPPLLHLSSSSSSSPVSTHILPPSPQPHPPPSFPVSLPYGSCCPVSSAGTGSPDNWWSGRAPCISVQPAASTSRPHWCLKQRHRRRSHPGQNKIASFSRFKDFSCETNTNSPDEHLPD